MVTGKAFAFPVDGTYDSFVSHLSPPLQCQDVRHGKQCTATDVNWGTVDGLSVCCDTHYDPASMIFLGKRNRRASAKVRDRCAEENEEETAQHANPKRRAARSGGEHPLDEAMNVVDKVPESSEDADSVVSNNESVCGDAEQSEGGVTNNESSDDDDSSDDDSSDDDSGDDEDAARGKRVGGPRRVTSTAYSSILSATPVRYS